MTSGLSHITFITHDLEKMSRIIVGVLGGREVYASGFKQHSISPEKFFDVSGLWVAIMQGDPLPTRTYNHAAFKVSVDQLEKAKLAIEKLGLEFRSSRPRIEGEGQSLYFHDYDNHLFELHTGTLEERLAAYKKLDET
jgi:fosfomycin resistance protein FosX